MGIIDKSGKRIDNLEESAKHNGLPGVEIPKRIEDLRQEMNAKLGSGVMKSSNEKKKKKIKLVKEKAHMPVTQSKVGKLESNIGPSAVVKELPGSAVGRSDSAPKKVKKTLLLKDIEVMPCASNLLNT